MRASALLLLTSVAVAGCGGTAARHANGPSKTLRQDTAGPCRNSAEARYESRGLVCVNGSLVRPPAEPTQLPLTKIRMPPAEPLPSGTSRIALAVKDAWSPGISDLAVGDGAVWVSSGVFRIGAADRRSSGPLAPRASTSEDIAAGDGAIWATDYNANRVLRFDPHRRRLVASIRLPLGSSPVGIATTPGAVWVANHHAGTLSRIDPRTNRIVATVVLTHAGDSGPQGVAAGLGSIWVGVPRTNSVFRVDPATNQIAGVIPTAIEPCGGFAIARTAVWVSSCLDNTVVARIDPATDRVRSLLGVGNVIQPGADGDTVWLVGGGDGSAVPGQPAYLLRLGADDTVERRIRVGRGFVSGGAVMAFGAIWISDFAKPRVLRIPLAR